MSGRSSRSTLIGTKCSLSSSAICGRLERLALHHVAPVTRRVADRQEDRLVLSFRAAPGPRGPRHTSRPGCTGAAAGTGWSARPGWPSGGARQGPSRTHEVCRAAANESGSSAMKSRLPAVRLVRPVEHTHLVAELALGHRPALKRDRGTARSDPVAEFENDRRELGNRRADDPPTDEANFESLLGPAAADEADQRRVAFRVNAVAQRAAEREPRRRSDSPRRNAPDSGCSSDQRRQRRRGVVGVGPRRPRSRVAVLI